MHAEIASRKDEIAEPCRSLGVARLEILGSAARGTGFDPPARDVDFPAEHESPGRSLVLQAAFPAAGRACRRLGSRGRPGLRAPREPVLAGQHQRRPHVTAAILRGALRLLPDLMPGCSTVARASWTRRGSTSTFTAPGDTAMQRLMERPEGRLVDLPTSASGRQRPSAGISSLAPFERTGVALRHCVQLTAPSKVPTGPMPNREGRARASAKFRCGIRRLWKFASGRTRLMQSSLGASVSQSGRFVLSARNAPSGREFVPICQYARFSARDPQAHS